MGGSLTVTGIMEELLENSGQLQIINGELEKVINKRREKMLQESDLIELLDGTDAFGKRTGQQNACLKPVVWLCWARSCRHACGRWGPTRTGGSAIDSAQVQTTAFEEKLVPRNASNQLLVSVLREILRAQHASASPDADQAEMAGGLALPEGGEAQQPSKRRIQLRLPRSKRAKAEGGGRARTARWKLSACSGAAIGAGRCAGWLWPSL